MQAPLAGVRIEQPQRDSFVPRPWPLEGEPIDVAKSAQHGPHNRPSREFVPIAASSQSLLEPAVVDGPVSNIEVEIGPSVRDRWLEHLPAQRGDDRPELVKQSMEKHVAL